MVQAVFTHKPASIYDDLPEVRYHFPRAYLRQVKAAVGDMIVYYEPGRTGLDERSRTGRQSYVAGARVSHVEPDPRLAEHYYAYIDPDSYFLFGRAVPFREGRHYYENGLRRDDGHTSKGAFGRAVRLLSPAEFEAILRAGFSRELSSAEAEWDLPAPAMEQALFEEAAAFERPVVERVLSRPVRDAAFTRAVRDAYGSTCAMTGLRLTNGRGRPEVQAAHIRPVQHHGPDSVRNGIALSGTFHWLFDRGLISVGPPPRFEILITRKGLPEGAMRMIQPDRRLRVPESPMLQPASVFLQFHRSEIFDRPA